MFQTTVCDYQSLISSNYDVIVIQFCSVLLMISVKVHIPNERQMKHVLFKCVWDPTLKILSCLRYLSSLVVWGLGNTNGTTDVRECQETSHIQQIKLSQSHPRETNEEITAENHLRIRSFGCWCKRLRNEAFYSLSLEMTHNCTRNKSFFTFSKCDKNKRFSFEKNK